MTVRSILRRPRTWLIGVPALVVIGVVAVPWAYINVIQDDPPERLTFGSATTTIGPGTTAGAGAVPNTAAPAAPASAADGALQGSWRVAAGSEAGYRVGEVLFGQGTEAVGRTSDVTGDLRIAGSTIEAGSFAVDMTTVSSDSDRRDGQYRGRIMDTATYPSAAFALTEPIALGDVPDDLEQVRVPAAGELTLRGVTNRVTFEVTARRKGQALEVNGSIPVTFADYRIPDASLGGVADVEDRGEIEFLLRFERAG